MREPDPREFTFVRPVPRTKVKERLRKGAGRLLEEFGLEIEKMLRESRNWSLEEWQDKCGLYADLAAVKRYVVDEDCFGFYEVVDGQRKVREGIEDGFDLASRFLNRLIKEGTQLVAQCILESYKMDVSWQARSGDRMELANLLMID